jgi:hypothetical protein
MVAMPSVHWRACLALLATLSLLPLGGTCHAQVSFRLNDMQGDAERLDQALQRRGSIEAVEMPLRDFADRLSQQFGVPIELDVKKLEEAGVNQDAPINKRLESIPLESILQHGLSDVELTFAIRNHVILITTPEEAESQLTTKIYPVRDLVFTGAGKIGYGRDTTHHRADHHHHRAADLGRRWRPWLDCGFALRVPRHLTNRRGPRTIELLLVKLRHVRRFQGIPSESSQQPLERSHQRIACPAPPLHERACATWPAAGV